MKYIKTYEKINKVPKIGDYIIAEQKSGFATKSINEFITNNIGKIIYITKYSNVSYLVQYENVPENLKTFFNDGNIDNARVMHSNEIIYISDNKEDLEILLTTKNYNI